MATFNKFLQFVDDLGAEAHDLVGTAGSTADTLKIALTNTIPVNTNTVLANITQITGGGTTGYTAGGDSVQNVGSETAGTLTVVGTDVTFTAGADGMGPFRWVVLYNDTATNDPLIGWWAAAGEITLADTETFLVNFGASLFTIV